MEKIEKQLNIILNLINEKKYVEAINIVQELKQLNNIELNKYLNIYMDLFSVITSLTRPQIDEVKLVTLQDVLVDTTTNKNAESENEKRSLIMQHKYNKIDFKKETWDQDIYQTILKSLIELAQASEKKFKKLFESKIYSQDYEQARRLMENKLLRQKGMSHEKITYILLEKFMSIKDTKIIPPITSGTVSNYIDAITNNNFELALKFTESYIVKNNIDMNRYINYLILRDLCKMIKNVKNYNKYCKENNIDFLEPNGFIQNKYDELISSGIVTTKTKNKNKIAKILEDLLDHPEISSLFINNGETFVLRYTPYRNTISSISKLMIEANKLYGTGKISQALELYLEAIKYEEIKPAAFAKIGLCLVSLKNHSKAIEFLNLAMELGKNEKEVYDFHALIAKLEGKLYAEEMKPIFSPKENKFDFYNQNSNFGLGDITELNDAIMLSGLDVESACLNLGMSEEEIELVKLVYAKEFFSKGEIKLAEKFLKSVEMSENKTQRVKKALDEVRKNKKIYINKNETSLSLSLKLKPKK